jgi:hypothetical protein
MTRKLRTIEFLILLGLSACASLKPATLNSYEGVEKPRSDVALIRMVSVSLTALDDAPLPRHPDAEHYYYREVNVLPGRHTFEVHNAWSASVLVSPSGYVGGSETLTFDLKAGHVYELKSNRTHGNVRLFFWAEDVTAKQVVAGRKLDGPDDKNLAGLKWSAEEKRIVLLNPQFDLSELQPGPAKVSRADWNETGRTFAAKHIGGEFSKRGIAAIVDNEDAQDAADCSPNTETGITTDCGGRLFEKYRADYGFFVEVHDYYSSRAMVTARAVGLVIAFPYAPLALASLALGGGGGRDPGDPPPACASLIDIHTGEVAWRQCINFATDWRQEGSAKNAIQSLLRGFPAG